MKQQSGCDPQVNKQRTVKIRRSLFSTARWVVNRKGYKLGWEIGNQ